MKKYIEPKNNVIELKDDICELNPTSPTPDPTSANSSVGDVDEYVKEERGWENVGW